MHLLHALPITLHALYSEDLNSSGKVEVRATLVSSERQNAILEDIVQRLSLESGISARRATRLRYAPSSSQSWRSAKFALRRTLRYHENNGAECQFPS